MAWSAAATVSYTHLRAHETPEHLVCRLLLEKNSVAGLCFTHELTSGDVSLVLYDVTTLYFEAEKEDGLRKVVYSKERRVDPQIVVGLLVDRAGFPLEIGCFE